MLPTFSCLFLADHEPSSPILHSLMLTLASRVCAYRHKETVVHAKCLPQTPSLPHTMSDFLPCVWWLMKPVKNVLIFYLFIWQCWHSRRGRREGKQRNPAKSEYFYTAQGHPLFEEKRKYVLIACILFEWLVAVAIQRCPKKYRPYWWCLLSIAIWHTHHARVACLAVHTFWCRNAREAIGYMLELRCYFCPCIFHFFLQTFGQFEKSPQSMK